jgi:futalosine hydrolase
LHILIVAATGAEIAPVVLQLGAVSTVDARLSRYTYRAHHIDVLITGVGMVATAVWCSRTLTRQHYDLALNLGVCGSFVDRFAPGSVVNIVSDQVADLGAEDGDKFLTVHDLQLLGRDEFPFRDGCLINDAIPALEPLTRLPTAKAITVNTAHGNSQSIVRALRLFAPDVESMEGAAFAYCCLAAEQPFAQVRAVSNVVERRNRSAWKLPEAIRALSGATIDILDGA